ncbi:MAG: PD-(D/E)XK nuclease family protein [Planctomycetota bacterium]
MTEPRRVFIGWDGPVLERAAHWLHEAFGADGALDLSRVLVVTPVARAGRWLEGLLIDACAEEGLLFTPPTITPSAHAVDAVCTGATAPEEVRTLAWKTAVASEAPDTFAGDPWAWSLALRRASDALATNGMRFADALVSAGTLDPAHADRIALCARLERAYLAALDRYGQRDVLARAQDASPVRHEHCVLVAPTEIGALARRAIGDACTRIVSLVASPGDHAERFDACGCPVPEAWADADLPVRCGAIRFVQDADDQAHAAWECVASLEEPIGARGVVVGVVDSASASAVARVASSQGVRVRDAAGRSQGLSALVALLRALAEHLREGSMRTLLELCRHPDVERWVGGSSWLERLDAYAGRTQLGALPEALDAWPRPNERERSIFDERVPKLLGLLDVLKAPPYAPLREHLGRLVDVLARVYEKRTLVERVDADRMLRAGLEHVASCAQSLSMVDEPCRSDEAVSLVAESLSSRSLASRPDEEAVELLGWLELATDPAPVCVVCDVSEGRLPTPVGSDAVLPEALRARLGLPTASTRAGRDAYLIALIASSKRHAFFVSPERTQEGDPLAPSRLLFRSDDASLLDRLERYTSDVRDPARSVRLLSELDGASGVQGFAPMPVAGTPEVEKWSVTSFRRYLASPYAFYVERVLGRREPRAYTGELDAGGFGDLLHDALRRFGADPELRRLTDDEEISAALGRCLHESAVGSHGPDPSRAVWIQIEQALWRLRAFARAQGAWARKGWEIVETEWEPGGGVEFAIQGGDPITLTGVIDRLDRNAETGEWAVIDYKSGAKGLDPRATHRVKGEWRDLQLPLYRHLARSFGVGASPTMAFGLLPPDRASTRFATAGWRSDELDEADACAARVVRDVRAGRFDDAGRTSQLYGAVRGLVGLGMIAGDAGTTGDAP